MPPELITGLFTGVGALIGVLGTALTTAMSSRDRQRQVRESRRDRLHDVRRTAYVALLTNAATFMDRAREIHTAMERERTADQLEVILQEYDREWRDFLEAAIEVELVGPLQSANSAADLRRSLGRYSSAIDQRYNRCCAGHRPVGSLLDLREEYQSYRSARQKFVTLGQGELELA